MTCKLNPRPSGVEGCLQTLKLSWREKAPVRFWSEGSSNSTAQLESNNAASMRHVANLIRNIETVDGHADTPLTRSLWLQS